MYTDVKRMSPFSNLSKKEKKGKHRGVSPLKKCAWRSATQNNVFELILAPISVQKRQKNEENVPKMEVDFWRVLGGGFCLIWGAVRGRLGSKKVPKSIPNVIDFSREMCRGKVSSLLPRGDRPI